MKTDTMTLAFLALLTAPAGAQGGVIPPQLADAWGSCSSVPWGYSHLRWQQLYEASAMPATLTPRSVIRAIGFRSCLSVRAYPAVVLDTQIGLYSVPITKGTMSNSFKKNRSAGRGGIVFSRKKLSLPPTPSTTPPSQAFHMVPLTTNPHAFTGPNLMIEIVNWDVASRSTSWRTDGCLVRSTGAAYTFGAKCGPTPNLLSFSTSNGAFVPGSTVRIRQSFGPRGAPTINVAGRRSTPLDLAPFGAPGCSLYTSLEVLTKMQLSPVGSVTLTDRIPNVPGISGTSVFTQWANLDPSANTMGISTSKGGQVTIGPVTCGMASTYRFDSSDTTGNGPLGNYGVAVKLAY